MSLTRKLAHNTIMQMIGRFGGGILAVLGIALITRYLGREGFGIYTTITSFLMFFGILINFGLTVITIQMISERDDGIDNILNNILTLRFISAVIFLGIAPVVALFFPYPVIIKIGIAITALAFLFQMMTETVIGLFQKKLQMYKPAMAEFISRIIFVLLIWLFIRLEYGILAMMVALITANFLWFVGVFYYASKLVKLRPRFDWILWKEVIVRAWPIAISIVLNLVYLKGDVIILSVMKNQEAVGIYGAPYKLIDALTTFAMMFMGLILPLLASAWAKGLHDRFISIFQRTLDMMLIVVFPMIIGTYFISKKVMVFIAGSDFDISGPVLTILVIGAASLFIGSLFAHTIVALDKQKVAVWGYLIDAVLSFIGYLIFIPKYSYIGAAWVTVFSEAFIAVFSFIIIYKYTGVFPKFIKSSLKAILASIPMVLFLYFFGEMHVALLMIGSTIIYGVFIVLFKGIDFEEVKTIIKLKAE